MYIVYTYYFENVQMESLQKDVFYFSKTNQWYGGYEQEIITEQ